MITLSHYFDYASLLHFVWLDHKKVTGTHAEKWDTNQQYRRWSGQELASSVSIKVSSMVWKTPRPALRMRQ